MEWVATSQDDLYRDVSRRLITMKKVKKYESGSSEVYKEMTRRSIERYGISYVSIGCFVCLLIVALW